MYILIVLLILYPRTPAGHSLTAGYDAFFRAVLPAYF